MNTGKIFEQDFKNSVPDDVYYYRINDAVTAWNAGENQKARFTPKNGFDVLLFKSPNLFLLELKSTKGTSFSFKGKSAMIKEHQIKALDKTKKYPDIIAGFLFNFSTIQTTYFLTIDKFQKFIFETNKSSLNLKDIVQSGGVKVFGEIKISRFKYDLKKFLEIF